MTQAIPSSQSTFQGKEEVTSFRLTLIYSEEFMSYEVFIIDSIGQIQWGEGKRFTGRCKNTQVIYIPLIKGIEKMELTATIILRGTSTTIPENPKVLTATIKGRNLSHQSLVSDWDSDR